MTKKTVLLSALSAAFVAALAPAAQAQVATGFQADRFNPSERGSEWFALDSLDLRGDIRPAIGVVGEWSSGVFRLKNADGSAGATVVDQQLFLHAGASLVLADFIRLGINVPINVLDSGNDGTSGSTGQQFNAPQNHLGLGDSRIGADIKLVGEYASPFTLAVGGQYFVPTGYATQYDGDGLAHGLARLQAAGDLGIFAYALNVGYQFRAHETTLDGSAYGSGLIYGAAAGLRFADHHLLIGPEIYGEANTAASNSFFKNGATPLEALLGLHYTVGDDWRIGGGAGPGLTRELGSPAVRVLLSAEWTPGYHKPAPPPVVEPPPPPPPSDKDGDGVADKDDACPDTPGVKTDDPKTNGCPPPPADKDGDGVADKDDACPDVPGVKTDDPKTNGCPADRDGDGILNADDACPDAPGPKTDDPKTNGCPKAAVVNGMIKISEQVKFATGSAKILKDSDELLGAVADIFLKHPEIKSVRIEGHTDNKGKPAANKALSKARAEAVKAWLVKHGIDKSRLKTEGFGQDKPIDDNATEKGRTNNRRVEFHIEDPAAPN